jgi:CheY-like chemotaxis protein
VLGDAHAPHDSGERDGQKVILIVEDDDDFVGDLEAISRGIAGSKVDWQRASSVSEGLSRLDASPAPAPDIAIVDIGLPDESGLEFVRQVRERKYAFPIVVISQNELGEVQFEGRAMSLHQLKDLGSTEFQSKTAISGSTEGFLRFVIAVSDEFDRILALADRPDRIFHSTLSRDTIGDLDRAIALCGRGIGRRQIRTAGDKNATSQDMMIHLLESAISKERLRLQYTLNMSIRDKLNAFTSPIEQVDVDSPQSARPTLLRIAHAFVRIWSLLPLSPRPRSADR